MSKIKDINCERGCVFEVDQESGYTKTSLTHGGFKLHTNDWVERFKTVKVDKIYEVRFKNTRKGYYENVNRLPLKVGDIVAVEGNPGHDVGIISMCNDMVKKHIRAKRVQYSVADTKKIYRLAKAYDIERWQEAISLEHPTMIRARQIAAEIKLNMKIGDVEYQGDKIKAIFYYIADERVDFRELIKLLADEFKIRIEMKQIGARQEAGRIGGIGSCGRELCCSSFATNFVSVTTNSARFQDILLNPQKLAGQCGKLKCCLNYEVDSYIDARKGFPKLSGPIQTFNQDYYLVKTDIFKGEMTFSTDPHLFINTKVLSIDTVKEVTAMNRRGVKVDDLISETLILDEDAPDYKNVVGDDSITRFDKKTVKKSKNRRPKPAGKSSGTNPRPQRSDSDRSSGANPRPQRTDPNRGLNNNKRRNNESQESSPKNNNRSADKDNTRRDGNSTNNRGSVRDNKSVDRTINNDSSKAGNSDNNQ